MPIYSYRCPDCGQITHQYRPVLDRDAPSWCACERPHRVEPRRPLERTLEAPAVLIPAHHRAA